MEIGQKVTVTVAARRPWNDTGVVLEQGHTYRTSAHGSRSEPDPNASRQTGELTCSANDVPFFYWNNRGEISLTMERVA